MTRLYGIGALRASDQVEAERWFRRKLELDDSAESEADSLWHLAVVAERKHNWQEMYELCSQVLDLKPDRVDAQGGLVKAAGELSQLTSDSVPGTDE